jgi:hypothetical protein
MKIIIVLAILTAAYSHYWPPRGGVNGGRYVANGDPASAWQSSGAACPADWPLGTQFILAAAPSTVWTCVDRGTFVGYTADRRPILDLMESTARYAHKAVISVYIVETVTARHAPE